MYQYSLDWFVNIFLNGICNAEQAGKLFTLSIGLLIYSSVVFAMQNRLVILFTLSQLETTGDNWRMFY